MGRAGTPLLLLAGFVGLVLGSGRASAQNEIFGLKLDGSLELGGRAFIERPSDRQSAKFEEYRDIPSGLFVEDLRLRLSSKDDRGDFEFRAKDAGEEDQRFSLRSSRPGLYDFGFEWDQIPHIYSTTGRMLGSEVIRGVFTLPSPRPSLSAHNSAPALDEIGVRWDTAEFSFSVSPTPDWELRAEYIRIKKEGDRPMGMSFGGYGNNFREILEPIDQTIHDVTLSASLARENYSLQFMYNLSRFQNALDAVVSDNPCRAPEVRNPTCREGNSTLGAPPAGQIALAPDNLAHTWSLSGGVDLPLRSRATGTLAYSWRLQNQGFVPHTINPALAGNSALALPQSDLDGDVRVLLFSLNAASRPVRPLTLTGRYRLYDFDDRSDEILFPALVNADRFLLPRARLANRFPFTSHSAGVDARWRILVPLALTVGMGWERWDRNRYRGAALTDEFKPKAALDYTPTDWILLRATYAPSRRQVNDYNPQVDATHQFASLRKFDEASRDRQRGDFLVQLTPLDTLTASLTYSIRDDDYTDSLLGLQEDQNWAAGIDLAWSPVERVSVFAGYMREEYLARQRSRLRVAAQLQNTTYDWVARTFDAIDTFAAGVNAFILPGKLDLGLNWNFSYALSRMRAFNPATPTGGTPAENAGAVAANFPAIEDALHRAEAFLRYQFRPKWTAKLQYVFESFNKTDFRTDQLAPATGDDIFLGNDLKDYKAHILALILGYRF
ncbi:MAG: MtrB/PioB family decaheme-associated outer membrane protein [Candidatus Rokubacteria bacterium]|nr:MtrB/PioB family decaheme-associated outer membrane protein [Candidatus Rokubacteria bacterium]